MASLPRVLLPSTKPLALPAPNTTKNQCRLKPSPDSSRRNPLRAPLLKDSSRFHPGVQLNLTRPCEEHSAMQPRARSSRTPNPNTVTARCTSINSRDGSDLRRPKKGSPALGRNGGGQQLGTSSWKSGRCQGMNDITGRLEMCLVCL